MKRIFALLVVLLVGASSELCAQVSIEEEMPSDKKFVNDMKSGEVDADYFSDAAYRAERRAIRKERNLVDFSANLHGSLTAFSQSWQAAGDNTITILANVNFLHTYKKDKFSITNTASAKFGYNNMRIELDGEQRGVWFKNVDELAISTAPQWTMVKNWTYGANIKFRTQFAPGYTARGDREKNVQRVSNFMTPGYFDASVGFTYTLPSEKFPLKINLSPIAMSATYRHDNTTSKDYGVPAGYRSKYEGGFSVQLDFDRTWGKNGWLRYRTTAYSFYGWITDLSEMAKFEPSEDKAKYEHLVPTVRWENTIDIKATKYISTQIYFQLYYNQKEINKLQISSMLSVGLSYTFKNK